MKNNLGVGGFCACLVFLCFQFSIHAVASAKQVAPGPVPSQISMAKRIFIANAGENQPLFNDPMFSGGQQRAYDTFYAAMKASGRYELEGSPADADLSFEIAVEANRAGPRVSGEPSFLGDAPYDAYFRLVIRDPKTNAILWVFIEHVQWAILQGNRDKNFDLAIDRLITDLQALPRSGSTEATSKP